MDEPFYFLSTDDVVPRDAVYVIIGGSVKVVPHHIFIGCKNLARVELQEGVEAIGRSAFYKCPNLTRVDLPSSVRTIDDHAFYLCRRLSEVILRKGLRRIGCWAFYKCDLRQIAVPSSVMEIGEIAFGSCERLSEVTLLEGVRRIGARAFSGCKLLKRVTVPSSVVEIEESAFGHCNRLEAVTLAGGMVMVARWAFFRCNRLKQITIPTNAIVVQAGEDSNAGVATVTGGIQWDPANESTWLVLASPHLALMHPKELTNLTDAINRIAGILRGAGPLVLAERDASARVRDCFVDNLSTWYRSYKREAATILELGLWKIELGRAREAGRSHVAGGGERARANVPTRDDCRCTCRADPIVELVLSSLAGPHRRADQTEMQDRCVSGEEHLLVPRSETPLG